MRRFGRQCRGQGKVFSLVRATDRQLLEVGQLEMAQAAQVALQNAPAVAERQRERLTPNYMPHSPGMHSSGPNRAA